MRRRHFELTASAMAGSRPAAVGERWIGFRQWQHDCEELANAFEGENGFDRERFLRACGYYIHEGDIYTRKGRSAWK